MPGKALSMCVLYSWGAVICDPSTAAKLLNHCFDNQMWGAAYMKPSNMLKLLLISYNGF